MAYDFKSIEKKWQKIWEKEKLYKTDVNDFSKPKYYVLDMFPYPSGAGLHVGHVEGYTATDCLARMKRSQGFNVLHPMGFDSFGLPAEQFAIKNNKHPGPFTDKNIEQFIVQLKKCSFSYDWDRVIKTSDPKFYKFTQEIFLSLFDDKLAYFDARPVNYCKELGTVLANEEVIDGYSERGHYPVTRIMMKQWILKITAYAEKLLEGLDYLDWPSSTIEMQKNWIGKSTGVEIVFDVYNSKDSFTVFTTRVDTLYGCTYVVLAPEHKLVDKLTTKECKKQVEKYKQECSKKSDMERTELNKDKTGVFIGSYAVNPINNKKVPIYIGDYVLASYGSGAVMAVPCHDQRDYEFAKKHDLPMIQVLEGDVSTCAYIEDGKHINSEEADNLNIEMAKKVITEKLVKMNKGKEKVNYKLRDWLFSRQRYWGEPIPVVHLEDGSIIGVDKKSLPVVLPDLDSYAPLGDGQPPLARATEWVNVKIDNKKGKRETNTMPQWAGSSWYYARFIDPYNENEIGEKKLLDHWLPVDTYIGGTEHAVLHLLYARFWHRYLYDKGVFSCKEPFKKLYHQGMILGSDGNKMSKSFGNTVNPLDVIEEAGSDSLRLYEMFKGPLDQSLPWSDKGIGGAYKFLDRVYRLFTDEFYVSKWSNESEDKLEYIYNFTVKKVTSDYEILHFNTAISQMMILVNEFYKSEKLPKYMLQGLVQMLAPIAPCVCAECYQLLGNKDYIDFAKWPTYDEKKIVKDEVTYAVQVNGKLRTTLKYKINIDEKEKQELQNEVLKLEELQKFIQGKPIRKVIIVVNKIINIVI